MMVINQLDVQRRGGACAKYPVSCVVRDLLSDAGLLKPFERFKVLDLTYGQGIFWYALPQAVVVGFDVKELKHVREPYLFYHDDCGKWWMYLTPLIWSFDLVVADPPWAKYAFRTRKHFKGDGEEERILNIGKWVSEVFHAPLLVHYKERWVPEGFEVVKEVWFQGRHRYSKKPKPTWFGVLRRGGSS